MLPQVKKEPDQDDRQQEKTPGIVGHAPSDHERECPPVKMPCLLEGFAEFFHRSLSFEKVVKLGFRIQIFFKPEGSFPVDDIPDLAIWVEKIPELSRPRGTRFDTGRVSSVSHPLDAEGALINRAFHPRPISEVMDRRVHLLGWDVWLCPVKDSPFVGACCDTVPATDAPVVIDYHQSIRFFPGGVDGAYFDARGILAVLALNR